MSQHEILTLQFGHYANFVGTHWWNIQENGFTYDPSSPSEINHDVLFREGLTLKGETTFTPRLLLVDLKSSLGALSEKSDLYDVESTSNGAADTDSLEVIEEERVEKNQFQQDLERFGKVSSSYDLDSVVEVWSDYLYTRLHPRSVNIVGQYQHNNQHKPFDIYPMGSNLWKTNQFCEDFSDKIRNYVEECDHFQGFHVLLDSVNGFSGLSTACIEHLQDDYSTKSVLGFPLFPYTTPDTKNYVELINSTFCFDALSEHCNLFVPLSIQTQDYTSRNFNYTTYKPDLNYHSSAILASALDTFTLGYRLKSSDHSIVDFCSGFSSSGRKMAAASLCLPLPLTAGEDFIDFLDKQEGPLFQSITPNCEISPDENLQALVLRGVPENRLKRPPNQARKQRDMPAFQCGNLKEMLNYYMQCTSYNSRTNVAISKEKMSVKTPYPKIFEDKVNRNGDIDQNLKARVDVENISVLSGVHNGEFVGEMLEKFTNQIKKVKFGKYHQFREAGVESDEFKECFERILDLRDCYKDDFSI